MTKRQRQLILRTTTLIIALTTLLLMFVFDAFMSVDQIPGEWKGEEFIPGIGYKNHPAYWFMFWTHLSNLGAIVWATLAWIALVFRKEGMEKVINGEYLKNLVFTFIISTGAVFLTIAYIPIIICYSNTEWLVAHYGADVANSSFGVMLIITTTFKHLFMPGIFFIWAILDGSYSIAKENNHIKKAMHLFIVPVMYILYVSILASYFGVHTPYPIFNFGAGEEALWIPFIDSYAWTYVIDIICILAVGAVFLATSIIVSLLAQRNYNKHELTEEIVGDFDLSAFKGNM